MCARNIEDVAQGGALLPAPEPRLPPCNETQRRMTRAGTRQPPSIPDTHFPYVAACNLLLHIAFASVQAV